MPVAQLTVYRHDRHNRTLITLAGEIDLASAAVVREALAQCHQSGIDSIEVDLTTVTFCDCSGLNAFLEAWRHTIANGGTLQLHYPPPTLIRLVTVCDCGFLLGPPQLRRLRRPPTSGFPAQSPPAVQAARAVSGGAR